MTNIKDTWNDYLTSGEKKEEQVRKYLEKTRHKAVRKMQGNFKDWDLVADSGTKYEVKRDFKGDETGNLFIELKWNGENSGLSITRADWWVHCCKNNWYIFDVDTLKNFIKANWKHLEKKKGGNDNNSWGVLIKKNDIEKFIYEVVDKQVLDKLK